MKPTFWRFLVVEAFKGTTGGGFVVAHAHGDISHRNFADREASSWIPDEDNVQSRQQLRQANMTTEPGTAFAGPLRWCIHCTNSSTVLQTKGEKNKKIKKASESVEDTWTVTYDPYTDTTMPVHTRTETRQHKPTHLRRTRYLDRQKIPLARGQDSPPSLPPPDSC